MHSFTVEQFRNYFPLLKNKLNKAELIYFDNGATTQKPQSVIDTYQKYYQESNANVHRASHQLSAKSTAEFEKTRELVQKFINARYLEEVIWTKGTTESVNLLANSLSDLLIQPGDEIILSESEHHANIVPWQIIAKKKSAVIKVIPLTDSGVIDIQALKHLISPRTKIISVAHISNVIGKINPIEEIISICKQNNIISIIDGAQAIAHEKVDVQTLDCDFYIFSAHKMYGPTGVGVLYGKRALLNRMPPYQGGGEMIAKVSFSETSYNVLPFKFEAGTPNISSIIAFSNCLRFLGKFDFNEIANYEKTLTDYCYKKLLAIKEVKFLVKGTPDIPLFSFVVNTQHNHDVASYLDAHNIAVRAGHHCAMPLMEYLKVKGCIRISLAAYNTINEVDSMIEVLNRFLTNENNQTTITSSINNLQPQGNNTLNLEGSTNSQTMIDKFSTLKGWDSRHREIMILGKNQPRLSKELLTDSQLIEGCESKAWITFKFVDGRFYFSGDSDAKVIRGLMAITLAAYNNKTAADIISFDIDDYFQTLGLTQHLSPSRANGLVAIVNRIKEIASN